MSRTFRLTSLAVVGLAVVMMFFEAPDSQDRILTAIFLAWVGLEIVRTLRAATPLDEVTQMFRKAEQIRRTDPAAAQRFVDEYFQEAERRDAQEQDALRVRASTEIGAATRLAGLLRNDLESLRDIRRRFLPKLEPSNRAAAEARNERRQQEVQAALGELEEMIRSLKA